MWPESSSIDNFTSYFPDYNNTTKYKFTIMNNYFQNNTFYRQSDKKNKTPIQIITKFLNMGSDHQK